MYPAASTLMGNTFAYYPTAFAGNNIALLLQPM
jgi:hypothetical protein